MIRVMYGVTASTNASVGSTSALTCWNGELPGGISETGGSSWKIDVPNRTTSAIATTNSGSAASVSITIDVPWSKALSRRRAETAPRRIESGTLITAAKSIRTAEFTILLPSRLVTSSSSSSVSTPCVPTPSTGS